MGDRPLSPARIFARPTALPIWLGPAQQSARAHLLAGLPVRLLIGPRSSGKSALLTAAQAELAQSASVLVARRPFASAASLLASLLQSAGLTPWELSTTELRNLLTVLIQQRRAQGRRVIVAVDDAHTLSTDAWAELGRLKAWPLEQRPAIELLLVGGPALAERHAREWYAGEPPSGTVHALGPPTAADIADYIDWRLRRFDLEGLITPVASQLIAKSCAGRLAFVDVLCQMSLLLLRPHGLDRVDARLVRQALAALAARREQQADALAGAARRPAAAAEPAPVPRGHLIVSRDGRMLRRIALAPRLLIGRSRHNDVCLSSPYLGTHHAAILGTPEGFYVIDLNSVNGVELNGERTMRATLSDHDVLTLGPFKLKVHLPEWIAERTPFPDDTSLADTGVMPARIEPPPALARIK